MNYFGDLGDTKVSTGSGSTNRKYTNQIPGSFLIRVDRCKMIKKDEGDGLPAIVLEGEIVQHEDPSFIGAAIQEMADKGKQQKKFFFELAKRLAAIDLYMIEGVIDSYDPNADVDGEVWGAAVERVFGGCDEATGKPDVSHDTSIKGMIIRYNNNPIKEKDEQGNYTGSLVDGKYWSNQLGPVSPEALAEELDPKSITGIHPGYLAS